MLVRSIIHGIVLLAATWSPMAVADDTRPNFIVIFTDDQGYNDLGCFGSPNIRTPNIDKMASEGIRLTSFYSGASVCTPSRAALLTGCYPERVGNLGVLFPNSDRGLNPDEITIAEILKERGYATACFGKWHLGHHPSFLPTEHGFDEYLGVPYSNDMGIDSSMVLADDVNLRDGRTEQDFREATGKLPPLMRGKNVIEWPADQTQLTKRYTGEATRFIRQHANRPFFIYLPHTMPHIPLFASDQFRGKSEAGLYGDTLEEIDWSVGRILSTLKELDIDDRTMIIYTSDNGPWNLKGNATDKVKGNMNRRIGGSAYPLRGYKFGKFEGGMRVPCVVRWPGRIPAGQVSDEIAASIDILPTIAQLAAASLPTDRKIDGFSIVPLLEGLSGAKTPHETYFYRTNAVRSGKWKLIDGKLFDLQADLSEATDVASEHPNVVARLQSLLDAHRLEMKTHGRKPAYVQRPAYPLPGQPNWIVESGRWNFAAARSLRQQADWTTAQLVSAACDEDLAVVHCDAKCRNPGGGFGIALLDGDRRVSLQLGAANNSKHVLRASGQESVSVQGAIDGTKWHHIKLVVGNRAVTAFVNGSQVAQLALKQPLTARRVALVSHQARSEFRNIRALGRNDSVLLELLRKE